MFFIFSTIFIWKHFDGTNSHNKNKLKMLNDKTKKNLLLREGWNKICLFSDSFLTIWFCSQTHPIDTFSQLKMHHVSNYFFFLIKNLFFKFKIFLFTPFFSQSKYIFKNYVKMANWNKLNVAKGKQQKMVVMWKIIVYK